MDLLATSDEDDEVPMPIRPRNFRLRQYFEEIEFRERFRLTRTQAEDLLQLIGQRLDSLTNRSNPLSPTDKLLCALRFYACGDFYYTCGDGQGISKASTCRAVHLVTRVLNETLFQQTIRWPENSRNLPLRFANIPRTQPGMPCVAGCVDGTLIPMRAPKDNEAQYVDRHGNHSINAMFVCGPNMRFYFASVRWPGAVNDARVLRNSHLCQQWEAGWRPFGGAVLLGDSAYPLKSWLMSPIANPLTQAERHFNRAHSKTRRLIECAYGIFKETFQCLK